MSGGGFIVGGKRPGRYFFLCIRFFVLDRFIPEGVEVKVDGVVVCSTCDDLMSRSARNYFHIQ